MSEAGPDGSPVGAGLVVLDAVSGYAPIRRAAR